MENFLFLFLFITKRRSCPSLAQPEIHEFLIPLEKGISLFIFRMILADHKSEPDINEFGRISDPIM